MNLGMSSGGRALLCPLSTLRRTNGFARLFKDRIILIRQCFIRLSVSLLVGVNTNLIDEAAALCVRILTRPHVPIMDKPNARRAIDIIYRHITQHRQNPIAQIERALSAPRASCAHNPSYSFASIHSSATVRNGVRQRSSDSARALASISA